MVDLQPVREAVVTLAAAILTYVIVPYIKNTILLMWVRIAVAAAEQQFPDAKSGAQKKQYVLDFLKQIGYKETDPKVDTAIEGYVGKLNGANV